jgi:hypothetical protein
MYAEQRGSDSGSPMKKATAVRTARKARKKTAKKRTKKTR